MADFHLWATINQTAPGEFVAIVSASRVDCEADGVILKTAVRATRDLAVEASESLNLRG